MVINPLKPEWPQAVADLITRIVGRVRALVTTRAVVATNALVFGAIAVAGASVAAVLGVTITFRALQSYLSWEMSDTAAATAGIIALVGLALLVVGLVTRKAVFTVAGGFVAAVAGVRWILDVTETVIDHDTAVWISYFVVGGWAMLVGTYLMLQRREPQLG
jgi:hypothetical protein